MLKIRTDHTEDHLETIALRVTAAMLAELDEIAGITEKTRARLIVRAIEIYLNREGRDIRAIADAQKAIKAGQFVDLQAVGKELDQVVRGGLA